MVAGGQGVQKGGGCRCVGVEAQNDALLMWCVRACVRACVRGCVFVLVWVCRGAGVFDFN